MREAEGQVGGQGKRWTDLTMPGLLLQFVCRLVAYAPSSQYTDTGPTIPSADPITPGAWQYSHWSAMFKSRVLLDPEKSPRRKRESNPRSSAFEADTLTARPTRRPLAAYHRRESVQDFTFLAYEGPPAA